jgi:hypothetical protein
MTVHQLLERDAHSLRPAGDGPRRHQLVDGGGQIVVDARVTNCGMYSCTPKCNAPSLDRRTAPSGNARKAVLRVARR